MIGYARTVARLNITVGKLARQSAVSVRYGVVVKIAAKNHVVAALPHIFGHGLSLRRTYLGRLSQLYCQAFRLSLIVSLPALPLTMSLKPARSASDRPEVSK